MLACICAMQYRQYRPMHLYSYRSVCIYRVVCIRCHTRRINRHVDCEWSPTVWIDCWTVNWKHATRKSLVMDRVVSILILAPSYTIQQYSKTKWMKMNCFGSKDQTWIGVMLIVFAQFSTVLCYRILVVVVVVDWIDCNVQLHWHTQTALFHKECARNVAWCMYICESGSLNEAHLYCGGRRTFALTCVAWFHVNSKLLYALYIS